MRRVCVKSASDLTVGFSPARLGLYDNSTEREGLFMRRLVLTFVIATAIVGCNRNTKLTRANFDKIQPGMTVAEVEELVEPGVLDPDCIHTPGIFVQRIIQGARYTKLIEKRTVRKREGSTHGVVA